MAPWEFYRGKRVFVTGHTGFKGRWLTKILLMADAEITGFALPPATAEDQRILSDTGILKEICSVYGDVRDVDSLGKVFREAKPEIVLHLAAQPLVLESYRRPVETYSTNVMGTVNLLDCVRLSLETDAPIRSVLNVTTDKVYDNKEWDWGYRETDRLDGYDPYSNSKSCSELVTHCYQRSFLTKAGVAVSTARAGNVIGGGDCSANRIIPDAVRAVLANRRIEVRNPHSIRPYQHVLEPLSAYLLIAARQYEDISLADGYNVGPDDEDCVTTGRLMDIFCEAYGQEASWESHAEEQPHEASFLKLDCSKIRSRLGWQPCWHIDEAVEKTVEWVQADMEGSGREQMEKQIMCLFSSK